MESILLITNNYEIDPELQALLEQNYKIFIAKNTSSGLAILAEEYIDVFIIMSDHYIEEGNQDFVMQLYSELDRPKVTPIIFSSTELSEELNADILKYGWDFVPYPLHYDYLMLILKKAMIIANTISDQTIFLKKSAREYRYKVKNILRIERSRNRHVKVHSRNPLTQEMEVEEFYFEFPLGQFIKRHGIKRYLVQSQQSWIVNVTEIKIVDPVYMMLIMLDGTAVPTSLKFVGNFLSEKELKK